MSCGLSELSAQRQSHLPQEVKRGQSWSKGPSELREEDPKEKGRGPGGPAELSPDGDVHVLSVTEATALEN